MAQQDEWGPWIGHDGRGMPILPYEVVHTIDRAGEEHISRADALINVDENGLSWDWVECERYDFDIIRYCVRKPRGLVMLKSLLSDLPEQVDA